MNRIAKKPALASQLFLETHTGNGVLFDKHDKERRRILIVNRRKAKLAKRPYTKGGRSAQYDTARTSPEQNQQSSAQYDTERTSPEQNRPPENTRPKPGITKSLEPDLQPQKW